MNRALHTLERQIATTSHELGLRRDLHGPTSQSYICKRSQLTALRVERRELKREIARARGGVLLPTTRERHRINA